MKIHIIWGSPDSNYGHTRLYGHTKLYIQDDTHTFLILDLPLIIKITIIILALSQSKLESFSLKTYKISGQQLNPKMLSVAISYN